MPKVVHDEAEPNEASGSVLDEIVREGARQMLAVALQAEVSAYIESHAEEVDENGHRLVVRNGHHNEREVITAAGPVPVRAPRVNDKRTDPATGERKHGSLRRSCPRGHASRRGWPRCCRCCTGTAGLARISVRR
jgi:putative transposase